MSYTDTQNQLQDILHEAYKIGENSTEINLKEFIENIKIKLVDVLGNSEND